MAMARRGGPRLRPCLVVLHRWFGLATAAFLFMAGITGSIIAFDDELDAWLNPHLFTVWSGGTPLPPSVMAARIEAADPRLRVVAVPLKLTPGESARIGFRARLDPATGRPFALAFDQLFADPASGSILGRRSTRDCCSRETVIPFVYKLHYMLHLPGQYGVLLMGAVALVWLFDCFIGAWLTLPSGRPFWSKWSTAWRLKHPASTYRRNVDLHRAGGLWLWGVLLLLAISSVYFNLHREVFLPVVGAISPPTPSIFELRERVPVAAQNPKLTFEEGVMRAVAVSAERGWSAPPSQVLYSAWDLYIVRFRPSQYQRGTGLGSPAVYIDAADGRTLQVHIPGRGTLGDVIMDSQLPIHSGEILGLAGRIAVCVAGIVVAMLAATGVVIWWKKRLPRRARARRAS